SIPRSARTSPNDLTRPSTRIAGPELVCDTQSLPDRRPFTEPTGGHRQRLINNRPPDTTARPRGNHRRPSAARPAAHHTDIKIHPVCPCHQEITSYQWLAS